MLGQIEWMMCMQQHGAEMAKMQQALRIVRSKVQVSRAPCGCESLRGAAVQAGMECRTCPRRAGAMKETDAAPARSRTSRAPHVLETLRWLREDEQARAEALVSMLRQVAMLG